MATANAPHPSRESAAGVASPRPVLHLDWETRSDVDITAAGAHPYAAGKNTDIMCAAYAFDDEDVQMWLPGEQHFITLSSGSDQ